MLDLVKVLVCLPFLLYACYCDIKTRQVSNKLWYWMLIATAPFIIYQIIMLGWPYVIRTLLSFIIIFILGYILFELKAFGGADAKALMVIALIFPVYPQLFVTPILGIAMYNFFALTIFTNSVILTILVPISLFLYNLSTVPFNEFIKKWYYGFLGYRKSVDTLKPGYFYLMENYEITSSGIQAKYILTRTTIDQSIIDKLMNMHQNHHLDYVWVTPSLPFMISITAGFLTAIIFGDIVFHFTLKYLV